MNKIRSEAEANITRGKLLVLAASDIDLAKFLDYAAAMEALLDEADLDDYFGTEGWRHRLGWDN